MSTSLGDLAVRFGCELIGDPSATVDRVATLANAGPGALSFFANRAYRDQLKETAAAAVVLRPDDADDCPVNALLAADPYLAYARIAATMHPAPAPVPGVHPSAVLADDAEVAASADSVTLFWVTDNRDINNVKYDTKLLAAVGLHQLRLSIHQAQ